MQDHLWESCGSVVSPDDLCRSLICLHRLSGSSAFSSGREDLRCRRLMLVSCHPCDVITWWEQKLSALKIVVLSGRLRIAVLNEKVSNHGSIPITIDYNVVAFIVFEEGFHQPIKRTKQSFFLDVTVFRHTLVD
ncbi:uncharacterized protein TNCV_1467131 [Trichonephila clavipes]|uniref:Uncharacterized protein n=1 Tax=Trichonephila clavipes TaxID=2585209 RepID=A0A8X6RW41_TRICX|nr:uncharacterized protein TNCV_1467131 [Trichonephila clavipes]